MLNAQWLETFVVLCEEGHFTKAAARLNMTQPGVSQQLRKLENQVGQALITRDGKGFVLTPAGDAVRDYGARKRIEECRLRETLHGDDPGHGEVAFACSGSLALLIYPRIIDLMRRSPNLTIRMEAAPQHRVTEGVLSGLYDFGIADHQPTNPRLEAESIGTDELCLLVPFGQPREPSFTNLEALGFIAHPDGFGYADELLSVNFPQDYLGIEQLRVRSFINQIGQIHEPVARGVGYTILPRSGLDACPVGQQIVRVSLTNPIRHDLWIVRRSLKVLAARTKNVVSEVMSAASRLRER